MKRKQDFRADFMKNMQGLIPPMLEAGIEVLIYAGDAVRSVLTTRTWRQRDGTSVVVNPTHLNPLRHTTSLQDFICNWMGNSAWTYALPWSGQQAFISAPDEPWLLPDGSQAGFVRSANGFTFLRVFGAGHMVNVFVSQVGMVSSLAACVGH